MFKKLFVLSAFICVISGHGFSQSWTTVTASNLTDLNQQKLTSGQVCFLVTDQNDQPISVQIGGGGQALRRPYCTAVTSGTITAFTVPNPASTSPSGIYYRITAKDNATGQEVLRYTQVSFTGSTFSLDNYVPANLGNLAPLTGSSVSGNLGVSGNLSVTGSMTAGSLNVTSFSGNVIGGIISGTTGTFSSTLTSATHALSGSVQLNSVGNATSSGNTPSNAAQFFGSWWNGTAPVSENWTLVAGPASTVPNPQTSFFNIQHSAGIPTSRLQLNDLNPATASANFRSPDLDFVGHYWSGTASLPDETILRPVLGSGANPASTLTLLHAGSTGTFAADFSAASQFKVANGSPGAPAINFAGCVNCGLTYAVGSSPYMQNNGVIGMAFNAPNATLPSTGALAWTISSDSTVGTDTGLTRCGSTVVCVGNGSASSFVGQLKATTYSVAGSSSGQVNLVAPAAAGSNTATLPAATGNIVLDSATQTLSGKTLNGAGSANSITLLNSQDTLASVTGNGTDQTLYSFTVPANTIQAGKGIRLTAYVVNNNAVSPAYKISFGATTLTLSPQPFAGSTQMFRIEIFNNNGTQSAQLWTTFVVDSASILNTGNVVSAENTANAVTLKIAANEASPNTVTPKKWIVELIQ